VIRNLKKRFQKPCEIVYMSVVTYYFDALQD